jgi:ribosomal protein S6--L-glutamate ligase
LRTSPDDIQDLIKMVGGAPLVIKLLEGTQGIGVVLAETRKAAESVIESFLGLAGLGASAGIHQGSRWR